MHIRKQEDMKLELMQPESLIDPLDSKFHDF